MQTMPSLIITLSFSNLTLQDQHSIPFRISIKQQSERLMSHKYLDTNCSTSLLTLLRVYCVTKQIRTYSIFLSHTGNYNGLKNKYLFRVSLEQIRSHSWSRYYQSWCGIFELCRQKLAELKLS